MTLVCRYGRRLGTWTAFLTISAAAVFADPPESMTEIPMTEPAAPQLPVTMLPVPPASQIQFLKSARIVLNYRAAKGSSDVTHAEAWITADRALTWKKISAPFGAPKGKIAIDAPGDGLFGVYLILYNNAGPSSPPPEPGTAPQQWVQVDRTTPFVQLLELRPDTGFNQNREVNLRWKSQDDAMNDRPVSLFFKPEGGTSFQTIAELQQGTSDYRWTVPSSVQGRVTVKAVALDRAGNTGESIIDSLVIPAEAVKPAVVAQTEPTPAPTVTPIAAAPVAAVPTGPRSVPMESVTTTPQQSKNSQVALTPEQTYGDPPKAREITQNAPVTEARRRYDLGTAHRQKGENAIAMVKFREALAMDPGFIEARNDLAGLEVLAGQHAAAEQEYKRVLDQDPSYKPALKSLALVQAYRKNYRSASQTLIRLLAVDPADGEAWLYLGDVTMFMGDKGAARQHWNKAVNTQTAVADVKERARKRLAIYRGEAVATIGDGDQ